jgi:hypothetical protein
MVMSLDGLVVETELVLGVVVVLGLVMELDVLPPEWVGWVV